MKRVREAVAGGNLEDAKTRLVKAVKTLDQAASKSLIHKNTASRLKSRLTLLVNKLANKPAAPAAGAAAS